MHLSLNWTLCVHWTLHIVKMVWAAIMTPQNLNLLSSASTIFELLCCSRTLMMITEIYVSHLCTEGSSNKLLSDRMTWVACTLTLFLSILLSFHGMFPWFLVCHCCSPCYFNAFPSVTNAPKQSMCTVVLKSLLFRSQGFCAHIHYF